MNLTLKKCLLASFLVLTLSAINPVIAASETQMATTKAKNTVITNLEAALKAVTENKLDEAQDYIDAARDSASDILGRCSVAAKKERGANALRNARHQIENGDTANASVSLKEAIKIFKSLLIPTNTEQPNIFNWFK